MSKANKKQLKKRAFAPELLGQAAHSLRKFRRVTKQVSRLSTAQKLLGGLALVAASVAYLRTRAAEASPRRTARTAPAPNPAATDIPPAGRRSPKGGAAAAKRHKRPTPSKPPFSMEAP
jgi:hypothetical protein